MHKTWHLFLGFISFVLVSSEDVHSEGLSSTSLLDLSTSLSNLEALDSTEHGFTETDIQHALLHTPQGSGFSSQETEEISIFQSPKYFWDDEGRKMNDSDLNDKATQTGGPDNTDTYRTASSNPHNEIPETSTKWLATDPDETPRQVSPGIRVLPEESTVQVTTPKDQVAPFLNIEERTATKTAPTTSTHVTNKPPRKNKKHSGSRSHHNNRGSEMEPLPGAPADSRGPPPGSSPEGHMKSEDKISPTQSMHADQEEEKLNAPHQLSTLRDEETKKTAEYTDLSMGSEQVVCKDWINLAGKNYVILNMSDDIDCEEFRWQKGQQLLSLLEGALSWRTDQSQRDWVIFLSKPNENDNHLLMTVTEEERVIPVKDVFTALADIKRNLAEIGIESYSSTSSCQSRPNPPRSDYGKLFIVLVIIGSICVMIIIAGLIYICWQRRLPKLKNMELHFVENGCHDNPTLDVAMDGQSEMQEKKPSLNGGTSLRADGWETLINKSDKEEPEAMEEDTHL